MRVYILKNRLHEKLSEGGIDCLWEWRNREEGPDGETGPLRSFDSGTMKTLCVETDSGYIAQAELEFLSSSDPPASGTVTRVRGRGWPAGSKKHKLVPKVE